MLLLDIILVLMTHTQIGHELNMLKNKCNKQTNKYRGSMEGNINYE